MRRTDPKNRHQHYYKTRGTPIPQQLDQVLVISKNKQNLQLLVRDTLCNGHFANTAVIARYVVANNEVLPPKANSGAEIPEFVNWTEEEDSRIVLYVEGLFV